MDFATIIGVVLAMGSILGGQVLEGGHIQSIMQATAMLIVLGGTVGAVFIQCTTADLIAAVKGMKKLVLNEKVDLLGLVNKIVELATTARREGILSLEKAMETIDDEFLRKAITLTIDGLEPTVLRDILEAEIEEQEEAEISAAKVWEGLGGYAPTIGIIGAVLGLIHVMENLDDPSKIGPGIAVAFVATVYGVGLANIFFLPFASKLKRKAKLSSIRKTLITEGMLGVSGGLNPQIIKERLVVFLDPGDRASLAEEA